MNDDATQLSLRSDLIHSRIQMGDRFVWVLKDPLSRAFFYFSERDYAILRLLDGGRKLAEIVAACRQRFAPDYLSGEALIAFLADARRNRLITSTASSTMASTLSDTTPTRSIWNPLAIRLPGIHPDRLLDFFTPRLQLLFSPLAVFLAIVLGALAALVTVVHFDQFLVHLGIAAGRSSVAWLLILAIVVSATKILHELAHAVACKSCGAECREIGVMFLVGIPCLYCDVSDAWMLPERWKRMIISAAGMIAELVIAAVATLLWLFSTDGIVRDTCVTAMVVCSVSTVLFNGNPLLRYDGYFMLSDLLGIPNLAGEASSLIRSSLRRKLWALPPVRVGASPTSSMNRTRTLYTYGMLSGAYRFVVLAVIAIIVYRFADHLGVGFIGACLAIALLASTVWRTVASIARPPGVMESRSSFASRRPILVFAAGGICLLLGLLVPLPRSIVAPTCIDAVGAVDVFLQSPGRLVFAVSEGAVVQTGDQLASFRNFDTEHELLRLQSAQQRLQTELAGLRRRRGVDAQAAAKIPAISEALEVAMRQHDAYSTEAERLTVRAPRSGRVFAPRNRVSTTSADGDDMETWVETPLASQNRGAVFADGTLLCTIGDPRTREAIVLVRQQDVALVQAGQTVELMTRTHGRGHYAGVVTEVATSPIEQVPREFFAAGLVDPSSHPATVRNTRAIYYQVRVRLTETGDSLLVRSTARARIKVRSASLVSRLSRFVSDSFRF